jgi:hypothetical protein
MREQKRKTGYILEKELSTKRKPLLRPVKPGAPEPLYERPWWL